MGGHGHVHLKWRLGTVGLNAADIVRAAPRKGLAELVHLFRQAIRRRKEVEGERSTRKGAVGV